MIIFISLFFQSGETLVLERAQSVITFYEYLHSFCDYCHSFLQYNNTFWPCSSCSEVVYCSVDCAEKSYSEYHHYECGIVGLLMNERLNSYPILYIFRYYAMFGIRLVSYCQDQKFEKMNRNKNKIEMNQEEQNLKEVDDEVDNYDFDPIQDYLKCEQFMKTGWKKNNAKQEMKKNNIITTTTESFDQHEFNYNDKQFELLLCRSITSLITHRGKRVVAREAYITLSSITVLYGMIYKGLIHEDILEDIDVLPRLLEHLADGMFRANTNGFCWSLLQRKFEKNQKMICSLGCGGSDTNNNSQPQQQQQWVKVACCLSLVASFFNHSCIPNVTWHVRY